MTPIRYDMASTAQPWPDAAGAPPWHDERTGMVPVREMLARMYRVRPENVAIAPSTRFIHAHVARVSEAVTVFTPDSDFDAAYGETDALARGAGFSLPQNPAVRGDSTVVVSSPNALSGRLLNAQEAVVLSRSCELLVVDERHGGFSSRHIWPLVSEFNNIVTVGAIPFAAPAPAAWALGPAREVAEMRSVIDVSERDESILRQWLLADSRFARLFVARLKSQLFRELRKLSLLSVPYPSWSNYLLARIERGTRDQVVSGLRDRGIAVYAPPHTNLRQHIRITAISGEAIEALKQALIEINLEV